jgi:hypothetical protein
MNRPRIALIAASIAMGSFLVSPVMAGPPLLCFPQEIGSAKSLPWGKEAFDKAKGYDTANLVKDTLGLLKSERSALVRMETLRRATIYLGKDKDQATELLAKVAWIAMDSEAAGKPSAEAYFNAGYLAASYNQAGIDVDWNPGVAGGQKGYAWVKRALELSPGDAQMEYGAALVIFEVGRDQCRAHLRKALEGASAGSPLAASIESNHAFGAKPCKELRKELGMNDASSSANRGG